MIVKTHMEDGLFRLCKERMSQDTKWLETHEIPEIMTYEIFSDYRKWQIKETISYAYNNSKFYKKLYDEHGVSPDDFNEFEDLEKFPYTYPEDIKGTAFNFLCISQTAVEKPVTFYSSGTTGEQKRLHFSGKDVYRILQFLGVGMNTVVGGEGVVQVLMPNGQGRGIGSMLAKAVTDFGMRAYPVDVYDESEKQIKISRENGANIWFGDTSTIMRITREMEKKTDLTKMGMKILFLTIGNVSDTMKAYLERTWDCEVITHYGLTEAGWGLAVDCECSDGYHYDELDTYTEVVDPETGVVVGDGELGELVFTTMAREAMPLIRYRSRDYASVTKKPCACGHGMETMTHIVKRLGSNLVTENGTEIYPPLLEDVIFGFSDVIDYVLGYKDGKMIFTLEMREIPENFEIYAVEKLSEIDCIKKAEIEVEVELIEQGTLKPRQLEKKKIHMM